MAPVLVHVQFGGHVVFAQRAEVEQAVLNRDARIVRRVEEKRRGRLLRHLGVVAQALNQFLRRILAEEVIS